MLKLSLSESLLVVGGVCCCVSNKTPILAMEATFDFWDVLRQLTGENYNCNIDPSTS